MNAPARRQALRRFARLALGFGALLTGRAAAGQAPERVIEIEARRFQYTPNVIRVKRGETVILSFRSLDFVHGFSLPDFGLRADLVPGQLTRLRIEAREAGSFAFLCDNFCGDGHEQMHGSLIVEA